jgi:acyl-CoA synthetase (AMP-forming)/AMP-acid ligase II
MQGYWALPEQTARGFLVDNAGIRWYRTGDIVIEAADGNYTYAGDATAWSSGRGYRVELGEIEAGLYRHPLVKEAAVVATPDEEAGVKITAFLSCRELKHPSLIELKRFCVEHLPQSMIPDRFSWHDGAAQDLDRQDRLPAPEGNELMDFSLTEEQRILRENIVRFSREVLNEGVLERDREQTFSATCGASVLK